MEYLILLYIQIQNYGLISNICIDVFNYIVSNKINILPHLWDNLTNNNVHPNIHFIFNVYRIYPMYIFYIYSHSLH